MAKRTTSPGNDASNDNSAEGRTGAPKRRRTAADRQPAAASEVIARADEPRPTTPSELPDIPEPGDAADSAQRSESMVLQPSEDDIRLRAYQRYLERGGTHGSHFDDWLEAERELKRTRSR